MTLRRLYNYMYTRLTHSNAAKTPDGIEDAIDRLSTLRDAWRGMLEQQQDAWLEGEPRAVLAMA